jgi:hypothetical protein
MTAITINPMVVALRPTNGTIVRRIQPTEHGGGVKKVLAVVVAVAIPIAAPAIASSIAASGILGATISAAAATTVGAVASSAIVGAGLGAISAKVMGGDVKSGAIMGAIGGGIGGYGVAQSTGAGLGNVADTGIQATVNNTFGTTFGQPTAETAGLNTAGADTGATLTSDASGSTLADATTGGEATLQNASLPGTNVADAGARLSNTGAAATTETAKTAMSQLGPDATFAAKSGAYLKDAGSALVSKVTDPAALASLTMQAGGQLLGAALAPDPEMPPEQRELLEMRKAELAELKERDENAFNAQMDAAKKFLQQAEQYDPTYMAFQAANKEAIDQQRKLREQYRKASLQSGGRNISEAEKRRMSLDSARNVSSRYDEGFQQGLTAQNKVTQAGLSAIPNSANFATYTNALQSLSQDTQKAEDAAIKASQGAGKNISDLFAGFNTTSGTGYGADSYWNSNQAKTKTKKRAGVDTNTFGTIAV